MRDLLERPSLPRPQRRILQDHVRSIGSLRVPVHRNGVPLLQPAHLALPADHRPFQLLEREQRPVPFQFCLLSTELAWALVVAETPHHFSLSSSQWKLWRGTSTAARATAGAATAVAGMISPVPRSKRRVCRPDRWSTRFMNVSTVLLLTRSPKRSDRMAIMSLNSDWRASSNALSRSAMSSASIFRSAWVVGHRSFSRSAS